MTTQRRINTQRIEAIRARLAAATPGPWVVEHDRNDQPNIYPADDHDRWIALLPHQCVTAIERMANADAAFIANSPTDIADLLAEVERLRSALSDREERLRSALSDREERLAALGFEEPDARAYTVGDAMGLKRS